MGDTEENKGGFQLSDKMYERFKFFVHIVLPAGGVLYASLSQFWGFPKVQEVVGSINAVALFLGVILRISSSNYSAALPAGTPAAPDGSFIITENVEGKKTVTLSLDRDPEEVVNKDVIVFKVENKTK